MPFERRADAQTAPELFRLGRDAARALLADLPGDPDVPSGWRGALQAAADRTRNDPRILTVADEVYAGASRFSSARRLLAYAVESRATASSPSSDAFLRGLIHEAHGDFAPRRGSWSERLDRQ